MTHGLQNRTAAEAYDMGYPVTNEIFELIAYATKPAK